MKSFKKYSWLITAIFAIIVFISGLTVNDLSFLPTYYQNIAVGVIGTCALIVKLIPENYRVRIAENTVHDEYSTPKGENDDFGDEE